MGTLIALGLHLLLHSGEDRIRRCDILQFHTINFYAPFIGSIIKHCTQLFINRVTRSQCLIKFQFTDDITQRRLRQLLDSVRQIIDLVSGLEGIDNLEVEQRIDFSLNVILRNHILLGEVVDLFAQVDSRGILITAVVEHDDRLSTVDERDDDVDTWTEGSIIASQTLNDLGFRLWDDHKCHLREQDYANNNGNKYISHNVHN